MKELKKNVFDFLKNQPIKGCLTGSYMIGDWENQDIDLFVYNRQSFYYLITVLKLNKGYQLYGEDDKWKYKSIMDDGLKFYKFGIHTLKFLYNNSVIVNIILKKGCDSVFNVLRTFDMDIISIGYDIESGKTLDLSEKSNIRKIANINQWNPSYGEDDLWDLSYLLRQVGRPFKYFLRGYNVDKVVTHHIGICDRIIDTKNIFKSDSFQEAIDEKIKLTQIIKKICEEFLRTKCITEEELNEINKLSKKL